MEIAVHWFRRDLRWDDNAALYHALKSPYPVLPIFIFDKNILDDLKTDNYPALDKRLIFIHNTLNDLKNNLNKIGSDLWVQYGHPLEVWKQLIEKFNIKMVFTNHDYEPYAIDRDIEIGTLLKSHGIQFSTYKDQCIFEKNEVVKDDRLPYTVFTPYSRKWKSKLNEFYLSSYPCQKYHSHFLKTPLLQEQIPSLESMGFKHQKTTFPAPFVDNKLLETYKETRDFPSISGTSRLGVHLRFGTVSIRQLAQQAINSNGESYLNELIWRDFYMMILAHFPQVVTQAFKPDYDKIHWRNNEKEFLQWCEGKTGYPIVDAGMRELVNTGYMHNRVRMIVASFLTKHLLIDWRWGEAFFAKHLLDFELASNNGGWQWAASSGCDAAPYFRVFNPALQTEKFDNQHIYIKKWIPEYGTPEYTKPMVEHSFARERVLKIYSEALKK